jgi:hypothetical protein
MPCRDFRGYTAWFPVGDPAQGVRSGECSKISRCGGPAGQNCRLRQEQQ